MNRDDIIELAREADIDWHQHWVIGEDENRLERFAALVAAHERKTWEEQLHTCHAECQRPTCVAVRGAVKAEREACALLVEQMGIEGYGTLAIAAAIRARGEE